MTLIMQVQAPKELHHVVFLKILKLLPNLYCHTIKSSQILDQNTLTLTFSIIVYLTSELSVL
jgi:hypothetical protein